MPPQTVGCSKVLVYTSVYVLQCLGRLNYISNANMQGTEREVTMLRDVLLSHNIMTERCFSTCITKFRQNKLTDEESSCIDTCVGRYMNFNQRLMSSFFEQQQARMKAIAEEQNAQVPPQPEIVQKT